VLRPLRTYTTDISSGEDLRLDGCSELRYLASAYNEIAEENRNYQASLLYDAEHDPLTGLPNRSVYERLYGALGDAGALAIIDVDYFKRVNDDLGHEVGDEALRRVANVLRESFASADHVCRIGGDEFAALRCETEPGDRDDLRDRIERARSALAGPLGCVPALTLSVGIAFAIDVPEGLSLYKAADLALYKVKERGRNGCEFYDGEER
jgi:diguanylate cyclase (GGDEF)-like protein